MPLLLTGDGGEVLKVEEFQCSFQCLGISDVTNGTVPSQSSPGQVRSAVTASTEQASAPAPTPTTTPQP